MPLYVYDKDGKLLQGATIRDADGNEVAIIGPGHDTLKVGSSREEELLELILAELIKSNTYLQLITE